MLPVRFEPIISVGERPQTYALDRAATGTGIYIKVIPQQAEVAQGVPGMLRPRIFLTFGTTRVVVRQSYAPAAFAPEEIPGIHFQGLSRPQSTWFRRWEPRKKSPVIPPGIDPGTSRLEAQCLKHYATPGPGIYIIFIYLIHSLSKQNYMSLKLLVSAVFRPYKDSSFKKTIEKQGCRYCIGLMMAWLVGRN